MENIDFSDYLFSDCNFPFLLLISLGEVIKPLEIKKRKTNKKVDLIVNYKNKSL